MRLISKKFSLGSDGDTIIEVMVCLAILSLSFAISYATANNGLNRSQNAQEHSYALGLIDSQIEMLRTAVNNQTDVQLSQPFCLTNTTTSPTAIPPVVEQLTGSLPQSYNVDAAPANNFKEYPTACVNDNLYHESISYSSSTNNYDFLVRWYGVGGLGPQQEELNYGIDQLSLADNPYANNVPTTVIPTGYTYSIDGIDYSSCSPYGIVVGDGKDGCFQDTSNNSMYAYRNIGVLYSLNYPGSLSGTIATGPATMEINYNQYPALGLMTSSYDYTLQVVFKSSLDTSTSPTTTINMPAAINSAAAQNFTTTINVPAGSTGIYLTWINNTPGGTTPPGDANLEINTISLSSD